MTAPTADLLNELLTRARDAAQAASVLLLEPAADLAIETKATPTDAVTVMDKRSESLLVSHLLDGRESDGVLGEEGSNRPGTSGFRWVIDPIDGTVNYLYGLPGWSVCVGLEYEGEPIVGVVSAPTYGVTYYAARGLGAFRRHLVRVNQFPVTCGGPANGIDGNRLRIRLDAARVSGRDPSNAAA